MLILEIKRTYNKETGELTEALNFLDGVKGTNTIGYEVDVEYTIYDDTGSECSEEYAVSTAGTYTVEYRFKDPKSGWITNTAKLQIEIVSASFETTSEISTENIENVKVEKSNGLR